MTKYSRGETVECHATFTDSDGAETDPTSITLKIYDNLGALKETKALSDLTKTDTGIYYYPYDIPADAAYGDWKYEYTGSITGGEVVDTKYFFVDESDSSLYCSTMDVYRKAGIDSTVISEDKVADHILDAMSEIDELYGKSFGNAQSKTEWFDTLNDDIESIESDETNTIFLNYRPVQTVTSVQEYDTSNTLVKTWTSDDYWIDLDTGILSLIDSTFVNQRHRVKVIYTYGYSTVPRKINRLAATIGAMSILLQQMGGTYDDVTSYSLPTGVSIGVGEPYMNMRTAIGELEKALKRQIDTIGRLKTNSVVI